MEDACRSGQPGEITRLIGCSFARDFIHRKLYWVMPTWVTPGVEKVGNDSYAHLLTPLQKLLDPQPKTCLAPLHQGLHD